MFKAVLFRMFGFSAGARAFSDLATSLPMRTLLLESGGPIGACQSDRSERGPHPNSVSSEDAPHGGYDQVVVRGQVRELFNQSPEVGPDTIVVGFSPSVPSVFHRLPPKQSQCFPD